MTPNQKDYRYPRILHRTEANEVLIENYRKVHGIPPLPSMTEDSEDEEESNRVSLYDASKIYGYDNQSVNVHQFFKQHTKLHS